MLGVPKRTRFGLIDWRAIVREVEPLAQRVGITAPLLAEVKGLSTAENWLINICRALVRKARLIVMDEPTASLSASESEKLFAIIRDLAALRRRRALRLAPPRRDPPASAGGSPSSATAARWRRLDGPALTRPALVEAIVGGAVEQVTKPAGRAGDGPVVLEVQGLTRLPRVRDVSFELHRGEVLGIGGLVGAGRTELARLIFGVDRPDGGRMVLDGRPYAPRSPADAVAAGLGLVPEERRSDGLVLTKSIAFNVALSNLARIVRSPFLPLVDRRRREALALSVIARPGGQGRGAGGPRRPALRRQPAEGGHRRAGSLHAPKVLILDEPTRGVDVGARAEIHRLIRRPGRRRHGGAGDLVRAGRTARPLRPGAGHGRGPDRQGAARGRRLTRERHHRRQLRRPGEAPGGASMIGSATANRRLSARAKWWLGLFARYGTILGLAAMIAAFSILSPRSFPTLNNFTNVLNQASLTMIIAAGLTVAVIVGELDLSIGFAASLHGILVTGLIVGNKLPILVSILVVLAIGALIGLVNGLIVTKIKVNSVIGTLGVGHHPHRRRLRLLLRRADRGRGARGLPPDLARPPPLRHPQQHPRSWRWSWAGSGCWWSGPRIGQEIQAVGGNPSAARLSGIVNDRIKILGFVISGVCAALTGILLASRLGCGTASAADSYLMTAFAAVFLGSATLRDGEFHILGTLIGALIIAFGFNGLNIFGAPTFSQYVLQGAILIVAVGLSSLGRSIAES